MLFYDELATTNELKIVNSNLDREGGGNSPLFLPIPFPAVACWFSLNNSETVKVGTLAFGRIQ